MEGLQPLLDIIAKQNEQIIELSRIIAESKKPEPVVEYEPTPIRTYPMHVPETEEDARALHEAGVIGDAQLEEVLRELEFFNTSVTVPSSI